MSSTTLYILGYLVFVAGVVYMIHLLGLSQPWIVSITLMLLGIGIIKAIVNTRRREPPAEKG